MLKPVKLNLQLFAEGETNPEETKDANIENKKEPNINPFSKLYAKNYEEAKEEEKPAEEKPETEVEEKPKETIPEPDNKDVGDKGAADPEYYEIPYNKEKVRIPLAERDTYLQKGYNYDKVKARGDKAITTLEKAAKLEGFDKVDDYIAELDSREKVKLSEQIEEAIGDPEKINEIVDQQVKSHPEVIKTKEERRLLELEKAKIEMKKDPFFKELEPEFDDLMARNPAAEPNLVYSVLVGDYVRSGKFKEYLAKEKETTEKKVLADVHDKERRAAPTGGDTNEGKDVVQPNEFSRKLAGIFGVSASKIAQRSHEKLKRS